MPHQQMPSTSGKHIATAYIASVDVNPSIHIASLPNLARRLEQSPELEEVCITTERPRRARPALQNTRKQSAGRQAASATCTALICQLVQTTRHQLPSAFSCAREATATVSLRACGIDRTSDMTSMSSATPPTCRPPSAAATHSPLEINISARGKIRKSHQFNVEFRVRRDRTAPLTASACIQTRQERSSPPARDGGSFFFRRRL